MSKLSFPSALHNVLEYLEESEAQDYISRTKEEQKGHIYESLEVISHQLIRGFKVVIESHDDLLVVKSAPPFVTVEIID
jgi:glutaredoxin 2